jgi:PAS domain S-box-containing protein
MTQIPFNEFGRLASRRSVEHRTWVIAALAMFCSLGLIWLTWANLQRLSELHEQHRKFDIEIEQVRVLDVKLTSAALLASYSGSSTYRDAYRTSDAQLTETLKRIESLIDVLAQTDAASAARGKTYLQANSQANDRLVVAETRAFELVAAGRAQEAQATLNSDSYARDKRLYAEASQQFEQVVKSEFASAVARVRRDTGWAGGLAAGALCVTVIALIARLKRAQRVLEETLTGTERLAQMARRTSNGVVVCDTSGAITWANEAFLQMSGYPLESILGRRPGDVLQGPLTDRAEAARLGEAIRNRESVVGELVNYHRDGRTYIVRIEIEPLYDLDGKHYGFMGIESDVTAQREAELQIKREHGLISAVLSNIPYHVFWKDREGRFLGCNQAFAEMIGAGSPEQLIGKFDHEVGIPREQADAYRADDLTVIESGKPKLHIDETLRRSDGFDRLLRTSKVPLRDSSGQVVGILVIFEDVTERRVLEQQLLQSQRLESIGQLAAGIAHEINTPTQYVGDNLRFIEGQFDVLMQFVDRLRQGLEDRDKPLSWEQRLQDAAQALEAADYDFLRREVPLALTQSLEGVERVTTIVRAMRDFSHPGSDLHEPADLNRAIRSTVEVCRNRWKESTRLELELDEALLDVPCRVDEMNQVILNLVVNASDAVSSRFAERGPIDGLVRVRTLMLSPELVEIRVIDNGTGIPAAIRSRVFDPFFTTKPIGKGTGQGLALSRNVVVQKHGGEMFFETTEGQGTSFVIRLPLKRPVVDDTVPALSEREAA